MVITSEQTDCESLLITVLRSGGVAIMLCDTIYGFIGIAPDTEMRINKIKNRSKGKPFLQLIPDQSWVKRFSDFVIPASLARFWPGPLTLIIPGRKRAETFGVRVPDDPFLQRILQALQKPLYSTSVNREGESPFTSIKDIIAEFEHEVDMIIDSGDSPSAIPSTIVDVTSYPYKILRQGDLVVSLENNPKDINP